MKPILTVTIPDGTRTSLQIAPNVAPKLQLERASKAQGPTDAPAPEVLRAAREFESIFLRTLLGSLEKTTQMGSGGAISSGQSAYGSMVVSAMADSLSAAGGIGLADVIARALTARSPKPPDNPQ